MVFDVVWGLQVARLLSILRVVLGPYFITVRGLKPIYSIALLLLSWFSFNRNFIPVTPLCLELMFIGQHKPLSARWRFYYLIFGSLASLLTGTGPLIARLNPSVELRDSIQWGRNARFVLQIVVRLV